MVDGGKGGDKKLKPIVKKVKEYTVPNGRKYIAFLVNGVRIDVCVRADRKDFELSTKLAKEEAIGRYHKMIEEVRNDG